MAAPGDTHFGAMPEEAATPGDMAIGVIIGRTSEFFDFFVYAIASVVVFPALVFPFSDALHATFWSFAIFPLGFIGRPLGTIIFMARRRSRLHFCRAMPRSAAIPPCFSV